MDPRLTPQDSEPHLILNQHRIELSVEFCGELHPEDSGIQFTGRPEWQSQRLDFSQTTVPGPVTIRHTNNSTGILPVSSQHNTAQQSTLEEERTCLERERKREKKS